MMTEIQQQIFEIINLIQNKNDMDQMIFDVNHLIDKISYKTINDNGGEDFEKKKQLISYEMNKIGSDNLKSYFFIQINNNNLWLFEPAHYKIFAEEFEKACKQTIFFQVSVAVDLRPEDLQALSDKLSGKMQRKVVVDLKVDHSIIGGAVIKKDNYILDYSIKTKLANLSSKWKSSIQKASHK